MCTPSQAVELANASSFGSGARFRKLGGRAALLDLGADQLSRVVVAREASLNTGTTPVEVLEIDTPGATDLVVTAVWNAAPAPSLLTAETVALACRSSQCELFGASAGATSLVHLEGFDLPAGVKVTDLAAGVVSSDQDFSRHWCAYGEGLFCVSKAGWQTVIPPQTSGTLTAVAIGTPSAAVSSDGRVFVEEGGAWVSHTLPFNDVISVTSAIGIVTVVGSDGVWYLQTSTRLESRCQSTGPLLLAWPGFGLVGDPWRVVARDGILYQQKSDKTAWCDASTRAPNLLAASAELCGVINNILAISETSFFSMLGPLSCGVS